MMLLCGLLCWSPAEPADAAQSPEAAYRTAKADYHSLLAVPVTEAAREPWEACIRDLQKIVAMDPEGPYAARSLYLIGQSFHHLYDGLGRSEDLQAAVDAYRTLIRKHPGSNLADDAQYLIGVIYEGRDPAQAYLEFVKVPALFPTGDMAEKARERSSRLARRLSFPHRGGVSPQAAPPPEGGRGEAATAAASVSTEAKEHLPSPQTGSALLEDVQYWSAEGYTRVVVYLSEPVRFGPNTLPPDEANQQPARIYIDFENTSLSPHLKPRIDIMDGFLRDVRVGQYSSDRARVVLDIESIESHKVFSMEDPFRVIIDVRGKRKKVPALSTAPGRGAEAPSLARQLGLSVRRIVLDPGHGGKDKGAIGPNGVYEKDVTLAIAKGLKKILEDMTDCEVILTRTTDRFLSLEERTAIANTRKADLFVSIHANAHTDRSLGGIETYFLNFSTDKESARVAAFENATSTKKISDLEVILQDLMRNTKISESSRLAHEVHRKIIQKVKTQYPEVRDLGVKQAPFYVLLGAEMPSILIETAFISNETEEKLLVNRAFQRVLAGGIAEGLAAYVDIMTKMAQTGEAS